MSFVFEKIGSFFRSSPETPAFTSNYLSLLRGAKNTLIYLSPDQIKEWIDSEPNKSSAMIKQLIENRTLWQSYIDRFCIGEKVIPGIKAPDATMDDIWYNAFWQAYQARYCDVPVEFRPLFGYALDYARLYLSSNPKSIPEADGLIAMVKNNEIPLRAFSYLDRFNLPFDYYLFENQEFKDACFEWIRQTRQQQKLSATEYDECGYTLIHWAARFGKEKELRRLITENPGNFDLPLSRHSSYQKKLNDIWGPLSITPLYVAMLFNHGNEDLISFYLGSFPAPQVFAGHIHLSMIAIMLNHKHVYDQWLKYCNKNSMVATSKHLLYAAKQYDRLWAIESLMKDHAFSIGPNDLAFNATFNSQSLAAVKVMLPLVKQEHFINGYFVLMPNVNMTNDWKRSVVFHYYESLVQNRDLQEFFVRVSVTLGLIPPRRNLADKVISFWKPAFKPLALDVIEPLVEELNQLRAKMTLSLEKLEIPIIEDLEVTALKQKSLATLRCMFTAFNCYINALRIEKGLAFIETNGENQPKPEMNAAMPKEANQEIKNDVSKEESVPTRTARSS